MVLGCFFGCNRYLICKRSDTHALLIKLVWSRWLDIDQFLFLCVFMDGDEVKAYAKKEQDKYPAILTKKLGQ